MPLMSKGEKKQIGRGSIGLLVDVWPSMPKGETVGNVVIDGKGISKGVAPKLSIRQKRQRGSRGNRRNRGIEAEATETFL